MIHEAETDEQLLLVLSCPPGPKHPHRAGIEADEVAELGLRQFLLHEHVVDGGHLPGDDRRAGVEVYRALTDLLGRPVDVGTRSSLKPRMRERILREAVPL